MLRISIITILFCGIISSGFAQDSIKKAGALKTSYSKYKAYKDRAPQTAPAAANPVVQKASLIRKDTATAILTDKSLNGRYQFLLLKVYHYQQPLIADLWKNAVDTLNLTKHKLRDATANLTVQKKTIDSLNTEISTKNLSLNASNARVNAVDLLGIAVSKSVYNIIMWGLVIVFGATAGVVILRSGSYSREARHKTELYEELEDEYKTFKAKANEKEIKLARELQTERNKLDELLGRG